MPRFDLPVDELRSYRPTVAEPADFDAFWATTLAESRALAAPPRLTRIDTHLSSFEVYDVSFSGFGGDPVGGWFLVPVGADGPLPAVVAFNGYGGGRGLPHERLAWAASGYAYFFMDTRGQGSTWGVSGTTPDPHGTGPSAPGFMTRGIDDPAAYYYRRVFTDAVLAIDAVRSLDAVDADRVAVAGGSQGGGIAIAAAGLTPGLVGAMPEVPFLCHFERAVGMTDRDPYQEIVRYLSVHRDAAAADLRDALVLRRGQLRQARHGSGALLGRPHGPGVPAVHGVRGPQPLGRRHRRHRGVSVQRARGRGGRALAAAGGLARRADAPSRRYDDAMIPARRSAA